MAQKFFELTRDTVDYSPNLTGDASGHAALTSTKHVRVTYDDSLSRNELWTALEKAAREALRLAK